MSARGLGGLLGTGGLQEQGQEKLCLALQHPAVVCQGQRNLLHRSGNDYKAEGWAISSSPIRHVSIRCACGYALFFAGMGLSENPYRVRS